MKHTGKAFDPAATALSAIQNASQIPVSRTALKNLLRSGTGEPSHIRALFGDVALSVLLRLAERYGISDHDLAQAYRRARDRHAAANPELDALLADIERLAKAAPERR